MLWLIYSILSLSAVAVPIAFILRSNSSENGIHHGESKGMMAFLLMLGLLVRILLASLVEGHPTDIGCFKGWAYTASTRLLSFYRSGFADYPPGYVYVLWALGRIGSTLSINPQSFAYSFLVKVPSILSDLISAWIIYYLAVNRNIRINGQGNERENRGDELTGIAAAAFYLFNPMVLVNSTLWGQVDSFFTLLVLTGLYYIIADRFPIAVFWLVFSVLVKPQGIFFAPVLILYLIRRRSAQIWGKAILVGAVTVLLVVGPFAKVMGPLWIFQLYLNTAGQYDYATLNAYNLFMLVGANWVKDSVKPFLLSYRAWGFVLLFIVVAASVILFVLWHRRRHDKGQSVQAIDGAVPFLLGAFIVAGVFMFSVRMHERYMYPVVLMLLAAFVICKDLRLIFIAGGFSLTNFYNTAIVLKNSLENIYHLPNFDVQAMITSIANLILFGLLTYTVIDILIRENVKKVLSCTVKEIFDKLFAEETASDRVAAQEPGLMFGSSLEKFVNGKEKLILWLMTGLYLALALVRLGSRNVPETFWMPETYGAGFIVDFGREIELSRMNYYCGVGDGKYMVEYLPSGAGTDITETGGAGIGHVASDDSSGLLEAHYEKLDNLEKGYTDVLLWRTYKLDVKTRRIRITALSSNGPLNEIAFFEKDSKEPVSDFRIIPFTGRSLADSERQVYTSEQAREYKSRTGQGEELPEVLKLFDEPDTIVYAPSYMTGTYFDEIYHARTAYEHLHRMEYYETTHPPLGKLFIGLGMLIFGVNPFGWRIVGTLLGVAMIPLFYNFARKVLKSNFYGLCAAYLLTVDFMHFTQTRIATIDTYGVFFIILTYSYIFDFAYGYHKESPLWVNLKPLFLSGLFFGLGVASKWIVLYSAPGLALIYVLGWWERWKDSKAMAVLNAGSGKNAEGTARDSAFTGEETSQDSAVLEGEERARGLALPENEETDRDSVLPAGEDMAQGSALNEGAKPKATGGKILSPQELKLLGREFTGSFIKTSCWCVLFFIIIPAVIYVASYIPYMMVPGHFMDFKSIWENQLYMYNYHSKLDATHSFGSPAWSWPWIVKPVWYYEGPDLPAGKTSSIVVMGNPVIWWITIPALLYSVFKAIKRRDKNMIVVFVGFCFQYVPWLFISRVLFIYHYFSPVVFAMIAIVYLIKTLPLTPKERGRVLIGYFSAALVLFIMFYPVLSGMVVEDRYVELALRWFKNTWFF